MPKTPPVVIPVIVDASGVDRGIADANRRLRYGTRGMAGTPSGFGSGGGAAAQGGGGGFASGIAAGAVAGAVAGRVARGGKGLTNKQAEQLVQQISNNPAPTIDYISQKYMGGRRNFPTGELLPRLSSVVRDAGTIGLLSNVHQPLARNLYNRSANLYQRSAIAREASFAFGRNIRFGAYGTAAAIGDMGIAASYGLGHLVGGVRRSFERGSMPSFSGMGKMATRGLGMLGLSRFGALGPIGAGVGIGALALNFPERMRQSFSDLTPFEGTMNYDAARRIRAFYNAPERRRPGFFQEFALGAEMANRDGGGSLLGAYGTSISEGLRQLARTTGAFITSPIDTIRDLFDPNSQLRRANQQGNDIVFNEWKRIMY
jgi:hypothetical protein